MYIITDTSDTRVASTTAGRSRNMRAIKRVDTRPELELRSALHARGYRFRKDYRIDTAQRRARPDVVFTKRKVAIFIDGCYWHSCPTHGRRPTVNQAYWNPKLTNNARRDDATNAALNAEGWVVIRIWEHVGIEAAVGRIERVLDHAASLSTEGLKPKELLIRVD
ncbi:very short patch repair endonuclease [Herbiconiux sp. VKM Ac-1786]|uniref:very short patch repair endonuclease n=1 Tax=Herbiconiux sp. VKM Ac-1786 TaxID=2783824 RepID=UPI00188D5A8C|nr:very short patch repair endonuclease [Herbiconiux sp. VKM Ac-1786]